MHSEQAFSLVGGCAETALEKIRENTNYLESDIVKIGDNTCSYEITDTGGGGRSILVSGTVKNATRKLEIEIEINAGKYNKEINSRKIETSEEKKKELEAHFNKIKSEQEKLLKQEQAIAAQAAEEKAE